MLQVRVMEKYKEEMTIEDVYEIASDVGKEFEKIIDAYGSNNVEKLMSKVIFILQHLENCCLKRDETTAELKTFLNRIYQLEKERNDRAENRLKLDNELEQIEDNWRKENHELINNVRRLQQENQRLQSSLAMYTSLQGSITAGDSHEAEENAINESSQISQLRAQCESQQQDLVAKDEQIEKVHEQLEECLQQNRELKRKLKYLETSYIEFLEEANLESKDDGEDSRTCCSPNKSSNQRSKLKNCNESDESPERLTDKQREEMIKCRFSFAELREIIVEKNRLKTRVQKLEDSLASCRCKSPLKVRSVTSSPRKTVPDDLPVQGPINKEPDEKLYPWKRSSKIMKFFPTFPWSGLKLS